MPDLLAGITVDEGTVVDYSINDEPMFTWWKYTCINYYVCKDDQEALKSLKQEHIIYITQYMKRKYNKGKWNKKRSFTYS